MELDTSSRVVRTPRSTWVWSALLFLIPPCVVVHFISQQVNNLKRISHLEAEVRAYKDHGTVVRADSSDPLVGLPMLSEPMTIYVTSLDLLTIHQTCPSRTVTFRGDTVYVKEMLE